MNQFSEMIREAFVGAEPYEGSPRRELLEAAIGKLEQRDRVIRILSWFTVTFMGAVCFWAGWNFYGETDTKLLILFATIFVLGWGGIAFGKMLLFFYQASLSQMRELKRVQLTLLEDR